MADFKWMFDQWIWKAGQPEFDINYSYDAANKMVVLNVKQTQREDSLTPTFRTPVEVRIKAGSDDKVEHINISQREEQFKIRFGSARILSSSITVTTFWINQNYKKRR